MKKMKKIYYMLLKIKSGCLLKILQLINYSKS